MDTNASQALKMAGGILIAITIIATLAYSFGKFSPFQQQLEDIKQLEQTADFNKEYEVYNKNLMYGVDILSVLNKAASNNKKYIESYGYTPDLEKNYLIEINIKLKSDIEETLQVFYMNEASKEVECYDSFKDFFNESDQSTFKTDIFNKLNIEYLTNTDKNKLWKNRKNEKIARGQYNLLDQNNEDKQYCTETMYTIIQSSINLKKTVKNTESFGKGIWTKAIFNSGAYNLKTKKFKCTDVTFSEITGRITSMSFEEI